VIDVHSVRADGSAQGTMGILGEPQGPADIRVDGSRVRVVNAIKNAFDMTLVSEGRLEGTVKNAANGSVHPWAVVKRTAKPCTEPISDVVQSYGPPKYCALDSWTFSNGRVQSVVRVDDDTVVMTAPGVSGPCRRCIFIFDANLRLRSIEHTDGHAFEASSGFRPVGDGWKLWDFPLVVGKSWRISAAGLVSTAVIAYSIDCTVEAYEDVTTKAGTFKAFKIRRRWSVHASDDNADRGDRWTEMVWFAPAAKTVVKRAVWRTTASPGDVGWELVSYSLK
jgi:hypothetical protein